MVLSKVKVIISCESKEKQISDTNTDSHSWKADFEKSRAWLNETLTDYIDTCSVQDQLCVSDIEEEDDSGQEGSIHHFEFMSDSEARERRRNKILASKDDRMSRILGQNPSPSNDITESNEAKSEPKHKAAPVEKKKKVEEKVIEQTEKVTLQKEQKVPIKLNQTVDIPSTKSSRRTHVLIILIVAVSFWLLNYYSKLPICQSQLANQACSLIKDNTYTCMISIFSILETEEFLFGRLSSSTGTPLDYVILIKDFVLFIFTIIVMNFIHSKYIL